MKKIFVLWKGFKFGMLLQLAIGPMCLMVFNSSANYGILIGLSLVLSIALIDLIYITLSGLGVAAIINKDKLKLMIKIIGCIILVVFGANMIAGAFHLTLLPSVALFSDVSGKSIFFQGVLLTASNPLTIIFWSGVFSTQVIENNYNKPQILFFGSGCVLATLCFLSLVAVLGTIISGLLTNTIIKYLNICVGAVIIYFGIRLLTRKSSK